jgi:uroporphyrinogen decarboxylase
MPTPGRQLIDSMLRGASWDRVGLDEGFWPETLEAWVDHGYPTRTIVKDGIEKVVPANPRDVFQFDLRKCGGWFDTDPKMGILEVVDETDEWVVRRDGGGASLKFWKNKSGTPEHVDFLVKTRALWEQEYRPYLLVPDRRRFNGKWDAPQSLSEDRCDLLAARTRGQWAWYGHVFVYEVMRSILGDLTMCENFIMDPGWIRDFNRVYTDFFKAHFQLLFEENGLPDGVWIHEDLAYKSGLFASPKTLRELFLPFYTEIVAFFTEHNLPALFHSDGNIREAIPLILEAGFVGLHPMEVKAGNDLLELADLYSDRLVFLGGLDVRVLETNDRQTIQREAIRLIEGMKTRNARWVFGSDHSVTPRVGYDTYRHLLDVYHEHKTI